MITGVEIVGVGMHPFGRFLDHHLKDLVRTASLSAIVDAGIEVKDIDAVYSANALAGLLTGQEQVRGQAVMSDIGLGGVPIVNVENACASGSTALREAVIAVRAGVANVVLVVGFEKMFMDDRGLTLAALQSAADLDTVAGLGLQFTAVYAMRLRKRLQEGSLTFDDLVDATVKTHAHGARNPYAHHRKEVSREEVIASRPIADPLTLLMCSSISDGAAAVIVSRSGYVSTQGRPRVLVRASQMRTGGGPSLGRGTVAAECAKAAYEEAGVGPGDLGALEVHDAMAPGELLYYEQLGLCEPGAAGELLRSGETSLGGMHVVNPSGGLSSRGHPVAATGVAQVVELTLQLRGEAGTRQVGEARMALAQNSGGFIDGDSAVCNVHIFEQVLA